jgi:hypothetical protein
MRQQHIFNMKSIERFIKRVPINVMFVLTVAEYSTRHGCIEGEAGNFRGEWQEGKELTTNHE